MSAQITPDERIAAALRKLAQIIAVAGPDPRLLTHFVRLEQYRADQQAARAAYERAAQLAAE
ncbi:MAG: hypothetical protein MRY63_02565 [Neomegalonema sp.]|nr:hypothetical protein [Neomegalonema sp.]